MHATSSPRGNILIVDDQIENLKVLTALLCEFGYKVRQAISGKLALKAARIMPPDLILLDICMPEMDGYQVCQALKADEQLRTLPVIFLSALESTADKVNAFRLGGADYITKPFQAEEVLARIETHLNVCRMQRRLELEILQRQQAQEHLQAALQGREALLKEVYHRTKNNMAAIIHLLQLESRRLHDVRIERVFEDIEHRIHAMLLVQQKLYQSADFARINLKEYLEELAAAIFRGLHGAVEKVTLALEIEPVVVSPDTALPCGLLLNELLTNAFKYAFPENMTGEVQVTLKRVSPQTIEFRVRDTGVGLPAEIQIGQVNSLGLELVTLFVEHQLQGKLDVNRTHGTEFIMRFPVKEPITGNEYSHAHSSHFDC